MRHHCILITLLVTVPALFAAAVLTHAASPDLWLDPAGRREYPNLLHNRSFEAHPHQKRVDSATIWNPKSGATRDFESAARTGKSSLKFTGTGEAGHPLALLPDAEYEFRVFWRGDGEGLKLVAMASKRGPAMAEIAASGRGEEWKELKLKFRTPKNTAGFSVGIRADFAKGKAAWVDDASLVPLGELGVTPAPVVEPRGATFDGAGYVTMKTDFPGGVVRFTMDGTEPCPFSMPATVPIRINLSCTLKAKVFHDAHREGATTEAKFEVKPVVPATGVPFTPIRFGQPVEEWWKEHVFNPQSANFVKEIKSPEPRINVADVRDKHPQSETAGIEEALAALPAEGGTLWFPKERGPYVLTKPKFDLLDAYRSETQVAAARRSNVHLLSDGAEIRGSAPVIFAVMSMGKTDHGHLQQPLTNWLVRGLTFDGQKQSYGAFEFFHTQGVLIEDCVFRNFTKPSKVGDNGTLTGRAITENMWVRRCRFESGIIGVIFDGVFNGGVLDCHFGAGLKGTHISGYRNSDMFIPPHQLSPIIRPNRHVVIAGNTFEGRGSQSAMDMVMTEALITGNRAKDMGVFIGVKAARMPPHNWPFLYPTGGVRVSGNMMEGVSVFSLAHNGLDEDPLHRGHIFEKNTGSVTEALLKLSEMGADEIVEGFHYRDNSFTGPASSTVTPETAKHLKNTTGVNVAK